LTTSILARVGEPNVVGRTETGLIELSRVVRKREHYMVFDATAAIGIADAFVE
jgi:hypothetical protein